MFVVGIILAGLCGLVLAVWTGRHWTIWRAQRDNVTLTPADAGPPEPAPPLSVLVAAKDEQDNIGDCVRTMLRQDYGDFELIVVNDRSADRTAEIVAEIAQGDPRVRLLNIESLPDGWCGKNHAMWRGVQQARGQWLCFIDADCRQTSDRTLSVAMRHAIAGEVDLLSVLPVLEMEGFWENVVQPVCGGIMVYWFQPRNVNSPARPEAYANGAFMLMKRSAYEAIGTHEAVKARVNEDIHMAQRVKAAGLRLQVVQNDGLYVTRMYSSLRQILNGWGRIFYGTFGTMRRLRVSMGVLFVMGLLPYLTAILGWSVWAAAGGNAWLAAAVAASAAAAMQLSVITRFYRLAKARPALCWTYPIGCAVGIIALVKAIGKLRRGGQVVWRSTAYATGAGRT